MKLGFFVHFFLLASVSCFAHLPRCGDIVLSQLANQSTGDIGGLLEIYAKAKGDIRILFVQTPGQGIVPYVFLKPELVGEIQEQLDGRGARFSFNLAHSRSTLGEFASWGTALTGFAVALWGASAITPHFPDWMETQYTPEAESQRWAFISTRAMTPTGFYIGGRLGNWLQQQHSWEKNQVRAERVLRKILAPVVHVAVDSFCEQANLAKDSWFNRARSMLKIENSEEVTLTRLTQYLQDIATAPDQVIKTAQSLIPVDTSFSVETGMLIRRYTPPRRQLFRRRRPDVDGLNLVLTQAVISDIDSKHLSPLELHADGASIGILYLKVKDEQENRRDAYNQVAGFVYERPGSDEYRFYLPFIAAADQKREIISRFAWQRDFVDPTIAPFDPGDSQNRIKMQLIGREVRELSSAVCAHRQRLESSYGMGPYRYHYVDSHLLLKTPQGEEQVSSDLQHLLDTMTGC